MSLTVLPGTQHDTDDYSLDPVFIEALWKMEERHFWHKARNKWILAALRRHGLRSPARILEVGCGSGAVAAALGEAGYEVTGVDTAEVLVRKAHLRAPRLRFVAGDVGALPEEFQGPYDCIGFFDVIEHLADPGALIKTALRWAKPTALFVATVPALQCLHTVIDDLSGHKKRYEPGELRELMLGLGMKSAVEYGIFRSTIPLQRLHRRKMNKDAIDVSDPEAARRVMLQNLRVPAAPVNWAMQVLCAMERTLGLGLSKAKRGASILLVASAENP